MKEEKKGPITDHRTLVLHSAVITPGCRSTCQRRSPLSSRSTGPSINGCANVVQTMSISNGHAEIRDEQVGKGKSSISRSSLFSLFLFYSRSRLPDLLLSRLFRAFIGQQARSQHFLLVLPLIYWRWDGIIGIRFHHH